MLTLNYHEIFTANFITVGITSRLNKSPFLGPIHAAELPYISTTSHSLDTIETTEP